MTQDHQRILAWKLAQQTVLRVVYCFLLQGRQELTENITCLKVSTKFYRTVSIWSFTLVEFSLEQIGSNTLPCS